MASRVFVSTFLAFGVQHVYAETDSQICARCALTERNCGGQSIENMEITEGGRFERWSHFKDYGVPGTLNDPVNKAAMADGACRLLGQKDGFVMWKDGARTQRVLDTLAAAPATDRPSYFTLEVRKALENVCFTPSDHEASRPDYDISVMASSMQNWYHALCAPEADPSWAGVFDPAYQPQQMAITTGLMCIVACDANGSPALSQSTLAAFSDKPGAAGLARDQVCKLFPWGSGTDFSQAGTLDSLAKLASPLIRQSCKCDIGHDSDLFRI